VETSQQMMFLEREDCNQVQGYFVGRPVPAAQLASLLASHGNRSRSAAVPASSSADFGMSA
jgi:EAL domain-containing protein (putative c-di-GMP-specific phosphodiesterase class I)